MPAALSLDLRERILRAYQAKEGGYETLAIRFDVAVKTVRRIVARAKTTGSCAPRPHGGGVVPLILDDELPELREFVKVRADHTAQELADEWSTLKKRAVHRSSMVRALQRAGLTAKKRRMLLRNKIGLT
jgi:transposase